MEGRSLSQAALRFKSAPVSFNDHFTVKESNAHAAFFGGLEWVEQGGLKEFLGYPLTIVSNANFEPVAVTS